MLVCYRHSAVLFLPSAIFFLPSAVLFQQWSAVSHDNQPLYGQESHPFGHEPRSFQQTCVRYRAPNNYPTAGLDLFVGRFLEIITPLGYQRLV
jgi:hypothetical protein